MPFNKEHDGCLFAKRAVLLQLSGDLYEREIFQARTLKQPSHKAAYSVPERR